MTNLQFENERSEFEKALIKANGGDIDINFKRSEFQVLYAEGIYANPYEWLNIENMWLGWRLAKKQGKI